MNRPNNELGFAYSDLYPNWGGIDTSQLATPEVDDQDALNEDTNISEKASSTESSKRNIFLALAVLLGLVIFFGGK